MKESIPQKTQQLQTAMYLPTQTEISETKPDRTEGRNKKQPTFNNESLDRRPSGKQET